MPPTNQKLHRLGRHKSHAQKKGYLSNDKILDHSNLKALADDKINVTKNLNFFFFFENG